MKRVRTSLFLAAVLGLLALCGSASSSEPIQGLISQWKFDEGEGSIAYDSVAGNHGTVHGAIWTAGQVNGALQFDGHDDYVDCGNDSSLNVGDGTYTLAAWIKTALSPLSPRGAILAKMRDGGSYQGYDIKINPDGTIWPHLISRWSSNAIRVHGSTAINDGNWHHVTVTYDGSNSASGFSIYIDGKPETLTITHDSLSGSTVNDANFTIGSRYGGEYLNSKIDEVAIYNRALSAEEIEELYLSALPGLIGLEIVGPDEVAEDFRASYKAIAHYDDESTRDVTNSALWVVEPNSVASIEAGLLTTESIDRAEEDITIYAQYTEEDVAFEAEKVVNIFPICPTGTALQFDGQSDFVKIPSSMSLDLRCSLTLSAWVKNNYDNDGQIIWRGDTQGALDPYSLHLDSAKMEFRIDAGLGRDIYRVQSSELIDDVWHFWAGVCNRERDKIYLYKDGILQNTTDIYHEIEYSTSSMWNMIGAVDDGTGQHFNGVIDEVRIYNRALSAEEIRANMHRRLQGNEPNLVGYWDFDEGEGQVVYDLSGNGNNGQLGSTPDPDESDPTWVESDAPVGICRLYQIATMAAERAVERKTVMLEELLAALAEEWVAYETLEELFESGDYGDLNKGDIVTAKQKIHSAIQHEEQSIDALEKSIEKLKDALSALGYEPEPPPM